MGIEHALAAGAVVVYLISRPANAQPPPPTQSGKTGLYLPIYSPAMRTASEVYNLQTVGLPNLFTANPNSGPQQNRPDVNDNIIRLKADNPSCRVLGYIATGNGTQQSDPRKSPAGIKQQVEDWLAWFTFPNGRPTIDGFMWDEADAQPSAYSFYQDITAYARRRFKEETGRDAYIRGNPGTAIKDERLVSLFDTITFAESSVLLDEATIRARTFWPKYPKAKFNYLAHSIPATSFTAAWFNMAMKYVGSIYVTDDNFTPNPWDNPSTYLQQQVNLLGAQA